MRPTTRWTLPRRAQTQRAQTQRAQTQRGAQTRRTLPRRARTRWARTRPALPRRARTRWVRVVAVVVAGSVVCTGCVITNAATDSLSTAGGVVAPGTIPAGYQTWVLQAGRQCGQIVAPLIAAQLDVESSWNPNAVSPSGAQGLAQFMPGTWPSWGRDDDGNGRASPFDPGDAIMAQARYMCYLVDQTTRLVQAGRVVGDPGDLALAAYNAGLQAVIDSRGIPPFPDTQAYVPTIRALQATYTATADTTPAGGSGADASGLVQYAVAELGQPYVWGGGDTTGPTGIGRDGRGPGFDCSGLVLYAAYQAKGIRLPHLADSQINRPGNIVIPADLSKMRPGDLIGFSLHHPLDHIGVYVGNGQMIDAPRTGRNVEYASLTNGYWASHTWIVRRLP
jgi:cell wall-associated NlpC family hydrolase